MDLCSDQHDEICYEGRRCPACSVIDDLKGELADAEKELREARAEIEGLQEQDMTPPVKRAKGGDKT